MGVGVKMISSLRYEKSSGFHYCIFMFYGGVGETLYCFQLYGDTANHA